MLGVFARAKLAGRGSLIREMLSGIGFVDVAITFSSGLLHIVELKVLRGAGVPGTSQLTRYMEQENRKEGWLVLFDARKSTDRNGVPVAYKRAAGTIRTVLIDINPTPPSRLP